MAVTISVQETTMTPTKDGAGIVVQMLVSDKPRELPPNEAAAMRVALTATVLPDPNSRVKSLERMSQWWLQHAALEIVVEALNEARRKIYDQMNR